MRALDGLGMMMRTSYAEASTRLKGRDDSVDVPFSGDAKTGRGRG